MRISDWSSDVCSSDLPFVMIGAPLRDQIDELPIYGHANGPAVPRLRQHRIDHVVEAHLGFTAPLCLCLRLIPLWPQLIKRLPTIAEFNAHASAWILRKRVISLCESAEIGRAHV